MVAPDIAVRAQWVHLAFEGLGYLCGISLFMIVRNRRGDALGGDDRFVILTAAGLGAMVGSRVLAFLGDPVIALQGLSAGRVVFGKTIVGALLGGWAAVEAIKARRGIRVSTGDELVVPLGVGIMIGRIGCFVTRSADGTGGEATSLPWAVAGADGIPRHPVALYEIVAIAALLLLATIIRARGQRGDKFIVFLAGYLLFRFLCDFLKPEPPALAGGLSAIQIACLLGLACYGVILTRDAGDSR